MDPNQLAIILGLLTNGLYSLILFAENSIGGLAFREEDIHERLTKNEASFVSIIEGSFQDISPVIKPEEFYEFLKSNEVKEIVKRIYSFGLSDLKSLNHLEKSEYTFCGNPDSFEKVKEEFCDQITFYFSQEKEVSAIAPQLFYILVECCLKSLDTIINEKQDLSALDTKIQFYFKINQALLKQLIENTDFIRRNSEAKAERSVVIGRDAINNLIITGDCNKIFIDKYETFRDAYIYPGEVFNRVDIDHFVGREWLLDTIGLFVSSYDRGYFILEGEAGFGKTAFLAWLVKERGYVHNFCELTPGLDKIGDGLRNLASQLVLAYNLNPEGALPTDIASRPDYLYNLLEKATEQCYNGEKLILVIDALDEAGALKGQNVMGLPKSLPEGVFIIASQRPVEVTLNIDTSKTPRKVCRLSEYKEKNEDDIRRFLYNVTTRPKIVAFLKEYNYTPDNFVSTLMEKCQGIWIYLHYVIPEIESGRRPTFNLNSLPEGLLNYYIEYWVKWREDDRWYEDYLPLLTTLTVAQEPVSVEKLAVWTGSMMPVPKLRRLFKEHWRPYMAIYLQDGKERYRFYHQSLQDLFSGRVKKENLGTVTESFLDELKEATFEAHNCLVERYLKAWGGLENELPGLQNRENLIIDDAYGLRYITVHLEASGRIDELHRLLSLETTEKRNAWYEAKDAYGVANYMIDVARAWQLAEDESEHRIKMGETVPVGKESRYALITASVNSLSANIPPTLLVKLVKNGVWTLNKGLSYARQIPIFKQRVDTLILIFLSLSESQLLESQREEILKNALDAATHIQDGYSRAEALALIAPHLPESMMTDALDVARQIHSEHFRVEALAQIAPYLPESEIKRILDEATNVHSDSNRAELLVDIFSYMPEHMMKDALDATMKIQSEHLRALVLTELAPYLPEHMMKEALIESLDAATRVQNEYFRTLVFVRLGSNFPEPILKEVLDIGTEIQDELYRESASPKTAFHLSEVMTKEVLDATMKIHNQHPVKNDLVQLVPDFSERMKKKSLDVATKILDGYSRAKVLVEIASNLPESMRGEAVKEALDATIHIESENLRAMILADIAPHLLEPMMKEALDSAIQIRDKSYRAEALAGLAPYLPESMMKEALDSVIQIRDRYDCEKLLAELAPYLSGPIMREVLDAVIKIQEEHYRAKALVGIAPHLPESMMKEALNATIQIREEYSRAESLTGLTPYVPESMVAEILDAVTRIQSPSKLVEALDGIALNKPESVMSEVLDAVKQINNEYFRTKALAGLAPYLPESMMKDALDEAVKILDEHSRAEALAGLAPYLPESMTKEALDAITQIQDRFSRAEVLAGLVSHLPESMIKEALDAVTQVDGAYFQVNTLVRIAPYLSEYMMKEALDGVIKIQDRYSREKLFAALTPYLPESVIKNALDVAIQIQNEYSRAEALAGLASHLPESMIKQALDAVTQIQDGYSRAEALVKIAPYLPQSMIELMLNAAIGIQEERYRASTFARIVSYLPESMMEKVLHEVTLIPNKRYQVEVFARMAIHLNEPMMKEVVLEIVSKTQNESDQAEALAKVMSHNVSVFSSDLLHVVWMKTLHGSTSTRKELFINLGEMMPVIYKLGEKEAVDETFYAIQDVARWWP